MAPRKAATALQIEVTMWAGAVQVTFFPQLNLPVNHEHEIRPSSLEGDRAGKRKEIDQNCSPTNKVLKTETLPAVLCSTRKDTGGFECPR